MKNHQWIARFCASNTQYTHEGRYQAAAVDLLRHMGCHNITPEAEIAPHLRIDVAATLPDREEAVFVECKDFGASITSYVDAVMQAASYADAMRSPVFIGPFDGTRTTLCNGQIDDGMSVLHLMAGRLNVGYLAVGDDGEVQLILRGVVVYSSRSGAHTNFPNHWGYVQRMGSRQFKQ